MSLDLSGKVAIVTGASRGIGRATALALAKAGADVVLAARSAEALEEVAAEVRALGRKALPVVTDVANEAAVENMARRAREEFGRIDILVNNAGLGLVGEVAGLSLADWEQTMGVNATGTFLCSRAVLPAMRAQRWGRIINVVSGNGRQGMAGAGAYSAAKHAVIGFSQSLAFEVRDDNITVSCVLPGPVDTEMRRASRPDEDPAIRLRPEDIAEAILFLATRPDNVVISEMPVRPRAKFGGVG